jgi:hypothetical protein
VDLPQCVAMTEAPSALAPHVRVVPVKVKTRVCPAARGGHEGALGGYDGEPVKWSEGD